ncbi:hypothetical protein OUZ56_018753 [Daphnia magna]|uniref:Uncharacterized protein n=1 Tax=Daphnia magna TaxID=35525 RepID=A0ABQ9Z9P1_9CRUS|nr:hypothetical protein OUZ56_018753 [Daphnia magna]
MSLPKGHPQWSILINSDQRTEEFIVEGNNFTARVAIRNYNNGLTETGGGPLGEYGILRPIYQKYYEEVLDLDNPAVSATAIPGAIDTDDLTVVAKNAVLQQQNVLAITGRFDQPTEEVISNETLMESSENNKLVATHYSEEQY